MMNLTDLFAGLTTARLAAWWADYGTVATVAGLAAAIALVALTGLVARSRGRGLPWLANLTSGVVLLVSSEGMFVVALDRLELPLWFAVVVFGVGELLLIYNALQARAFLIQAAHAGGDALEADALNGPGAGDPAREREEDLRQRAARRRLLVWIVAVVSGAIVALNVDTTGEAALRFVLPLAAASQWLDSITPPRGGKRRGVSLWPPLRKLLIRAGLISPGEQDVATINREYHVRAMVNLEVTLTIDPPRTRRAARLERRLIRLGQTADAAMIAEAAERVDNALSIRRRLAPTSSSDAEETAPETVPTVNSEVSTNENANEPIAAWLAEKVVGEHRNGSAVPPADGFTAELALTPVPPWSSSPPAPEVSDTVPEEPQDAEPQDPSGGGPSDRAEEVAARLRDDLAAGRVARPLKVTHVKARYVTSYRNAKAAIAKVNGS